MKVNSLHYLCPLKFEICMNLIVDIGNSSIKVALFEADQLRWNERVDYALVSELQRIASDFEIEACAWSSVGQRDTQIDETLHKLFPYVLEINGTTPTPLVCDYETPSTLGADRLAAAVGAFASQPNVPLLIIDAGTCITYDYVSAEGHYLGGNISPGLGIRLRALHDQTARLPLVSSEGELPLIGTHTHAAIRAGVVWGMEYEIEGYIRAFQQQHADARIFLTGGNGHRFAQKLPVERNDLLVETGLNQILLYNLRQTFQG